MEDKKRKKEDKKKKEATQKVSWALGLSLYLSAIHECLPALLEYLTHRQPEAFISLFES